jgi:hypothetical protein
MLDIKLLSLLQCPKCKEGSLKEVSETEIMCEKCEKSYLVKDNIPVLLVDEY